MAVAEITKKAEKKLPEWAVFNIDEVLALYAQLSVVNVKPNKTAREVVLGNVKIIQNTQNYTVSVYLMGSGELKDYDYARFYLMPMPGCCGVIVSTGTNVNHDFANRGVGQRLMELKFALARKMGYTSMICTTLVIPAEIHILEKTGWKQVGSFVNSRTGRTVIYYTKNLREPQ